MSTVATVPRPRVSSDERSDRVSLSADFLFELGELLERHGHVPAHGSIPGAIGYATVELAAFLRAYRDVPEPTP